MATATGAGGRTSVVPANQASWNDLELIFDGVKRHGSPCYCQRFKVADRLWSDTGPDERRFRLRSETDCGQRDAESTSGLVAFVGDEPAGWCAVEPRVNYPGLRTTRVVWSERNDDKSDPSVWSITCMIVRRQFRRQRLTYALVAAAVEHARRNGAAAIEGYPMITAPDVDITWGELHVGPVGAFRAAGFREVTHPTTRRIVMRIDLGLTNG